MTAVAKPIQKPVRVDPALPRDINDSRPTETRYAWVPFKPINLVGPDGTISMYVQPHQIATGEYDPVTGDPIVIPNPYCRELPRMQLIPFPTFPQITFVLSEELKDSKGSALPVQSTRTATALENVASVSRVYSGQGFTVFPSLQGLDEETAYRIFQVVQPFEYPLRDLEGELEFGSIERIESREPIVFDLGDDGEYRIEPLRTDMERATARRLAAEMLTGAGYAVGHANTVVQDTIVSIQARLAGGQGKAGPDDLDKWCAEQLGREGEYPTALGNKAASADPALGQKIDFLVGREVERSDKERIAMLEDQIAQLKAGQSPAVADNSTSDEGEKDATQVEMGTCGHVKTDGTACKRKTPLGQKCGEHAE